MYLTVKQQVKQLTKEDYRNIKKLCHIAKNLANEAIYNVRQYYFQEKKYLNDYQNWNLLKHSVNYKKLQVHVAQHIIKEVDMMVRSFFALLKLKKEGKYSHPVRLPQYLPKDGFTALTIADFNLNGGKLTIPYSQKFKSVHKRIKVKIPPILKGRKVKIVRIIPKANARYFEIHYIYEVIEEQRELDKTKALAIDFGINNLAACATNTGETFIVDGRRLKSINQWYNKENARLQSIKDRQKHNKKPTRRQTAIARRKNNRVNDYMSKAARLIIKYCLTQNIGHLVCGHSPDFQRNCNMGKITNQNFVSIPFFKLRSKLKYLCEYFGIEYMEQEESYTSKASFWDRDILPVYDPKSQSEYKFSGRRVHRGLYRTAQGCEFNADVNGALNILRKSNVVSLEGLYNRGGLDTPARIRIA